MSEPIILRCKKTYIIKGKIVGGCGQLPTVYEKYGTWYASCKCMTGNDKYACCSMTRKGAIDQWNEMQDMTKIYHNKGAKIEYTRTGKRGERRYRQPKKTDE